MLLSPAITVATGVAAARDGGDDVRLTSSSAAANDAADVERARRASPPTR